MLTINKTLVKIGSAKYISIFDANLVTGKFLWQNKIVG